MGKLVMTSVTDRDTGAEDTKLLYGIEWKPQLGLLGPQGLHRICNAASFVRDETGMANFRRVLEPTLDRIVCKTVNELSEADRQRVPEFLKKHVLWMKYHATRVLASQVTNRDFTGQEVSSTRWNLSLTRLSRMTWLLTRSRSSPGLGV